MQYVLDLEIGRQIEEVVGDRAEYGTGLLKYLAERLTEEFGKGFDESSLRRMRQFHKSFPIRATLWHELSWSHYVTQCPNCDKINVKEKKVWGLSKQLWVPPAAF